MNASEKKTGDYFRWRLGDTLIALLLIVAGVMVLWHSPQDWDAGLFLMVVYPLIRALAIRNTKAGRSW